MHQTHTQRGMTFRKKKKKKLKKWLLLFQNYNKSRIHSYRGAKDIEVTLDGEAVFKGEIARACGGVLGGSEAFGDVSITT